MGTGLLWEKGGLMIASMLMLDRSAIQQAGIMDPYELHKFVYSLFPGDRRTFLYLDEGGDAMGRHLLILSKKQPLVPNYGSIESRKVPDTFLQKDTYAFSVKLNPIERRNGGKRRIPVITQSNLNDWFLRRQIDWGFEADPSNLEILDTGVEEIRKQEHLIIFNKATFKGVLRVTDRKGFIRSFENGIGRGKAFGFGLLQLQPL
jgi:CRISPR system Cascade subunit CasE